MYPISWQSWLVFFGEEIPRRGDLNIAYYKSAYMYSVYMYIAQPTRGTCTHWKESSHVATATGDVDRFFWTCFLCHDANIQFVKARTGYSHLFFRELIQQPYCWVTIQHIILLNISQDIQVWIRPNSSDTIVPNPPASASRGKEAPAERAEMPTSGTNSSGALNITWRWTLHCCTRDSGPKKQESRVHEISCASTTTAFFGK